jgi:hypothetical protein
MIVDPSRRQTAGAREPEPWGWGAWKKALVTLANHLDQRSFQRDMPTLLLLFLSAVRGHRSERPILGERKKRFPIFVRVGFDCPLEAHTGKLPISAGCYHGGVVSAESPRPVKTNSHGRPRLFQKAHRSPVFDRRPAAVRKTGAFWLRDA